MAKVIVIAEHDNGRIKRATLEIISFSFASGNETNVILSGDDVEGLTDELSAYGAQKIFLAQSPNLKYYTAEAYSKIIYGTIGSVLPDIVLASHSSMGRDLMPHLAAKLGVGLVSDCTELKCDNGKLIVRRPLFSGRATAEVEFIGTGPKLATIRQNVFRLTKPDSVNTFDVININPELSELKTKVVNVVQGLRTRPDVSEASIVVSGGRPFKSIENFKILEELADVLGAAIGASRAVVDAGYRPHCDQVGQTGKVISPDLYIACGISGSIQHLAGMRTSKVVVAINTDPEAPIFRIADYGVAGDLFTIIPLLTSELKKLKEV